MKILSALCAAFTLALCLPFSASAAWAPSASAPAQEISAALNKMACYVQALSDYKTSKFRHAVEDRYTAWDSRHENSADPYHKPRFREAVNGFGGRYDRAVSDNAGFEFKLEPADSALAQFDESYKKLFKLLKDIDRYYSRGDWKEGGEQAAHDQVQAGEYMRELRVGLLPLVKAHGQLLETYDALYGPLVDSCTARLEKAGSKNYFWHVALLMRQAQKMLPMAPLDPAGFNAQAFKTELDKFVALADAHEDYLDSAGEAFREEANSKLRTSLSDSFISAARTMLAAKNEGVVNRYLNYIPVLHSAYNNMAGDVYQIRFKSEEYPRIPVRSQEAPKPEDDQK